MAESEICMDMDHTWRSDPSEFVELTSVQQTLTQFVPKNETPTSSGDSSSHILVTEKPHFLEEFGEDIVKFAKGKSASLSQLSSGINIPLEQPHKHLDSSPDIRYGRFCNHALNLHKDIMTYQTGRHYMKN